MSESSLYQRLGGYDALAAVSDAFLARVVDDEKLRRFWDHRGADGVAREKQLLIDYLSEATGGPVLYVGRDMKTVHVGMRIDDDDWQRLTGHLTATLNAFEVPETEKGEVLTFIESLKGDIVELD
jgi:hemoglobin